MKTEATQVSIIASVFNEEENIGKTIKSVLEQTFVNFEFIIVNDCSEDKSYDVLEKYANSDNRVKILSNRKKLGLTKSLNKALYIAKNNLIARIDAGDIWIKHKLANQVAFITENPDFVIVGTNVLSYNHQTSEVEKIYLPQTNSEIIKRCFSSPPFIHPAILFKKDRIDNYNERFKVGQDYELYSRILRKGKGYNIQKFLTEIVTHQQKSISIIKWKKQKIAKIKIRYNMFKEHKLSLWNYMRLLPDIFWLIVPVGAKIWKNKLLAILKKKKWIKTLLL